MSAHTISTINQPAATDLSQLTPSAKAAVLIEALPYITRFWEKIVVVKYGGNVLSGTDEATALKLFAEDVVLMRSVGMHPVVVHGGGPQIADMLKRLDIKSEFRNGLRVTDAATLEVARMVLVGKVNRDIVAAINTHGALAVGMSGEDANLLRVSCRDPELGFVGDVEEVNTMVLHRLLKDELIPVIATIGCDRDGQAFNINADTAAGAIAGALKAEKLVYLTNIEGIRRDVNDASSLIRSITVNDLQHLLHDGTLTEGMIPKIESCLHAIRCGVAKAHILDGRSPHALLLEVFTQAGIGTEVTA
jgi:acetylglutamate kinase